MLLSRKWAAGLGGYLMMDLSYACIPNSDGNLVRICREPFIDEYLETSEDGLKNTYGEGSLSVERINLVNDDEDYPPVFFMGVGSSESEDEDDVRFRQELVHRKPVGEIMYDNYEHFSDAPDHLSQLSIESLEFTLQNEASTTREGLPNPSTRRTCCRIREIRQDLRDNLRQEMTDHIHRRWEEDALIDDPPSEEFSLNNLFTFQANDSSQVAETEKPNHSSP